MNPNGSKRPYAYQVSLIKWGYILIFFCQRVYINFNRQKVVVSLTFSEPKFTHPVIQALIYKAGHESIAAMFIDKSDLLTKKKKKTGS